MIHRLLPQRFRFDRSWGLQVRPWHWSPTISHEQPGSQIADLVHGLHQLKHEFFDSTFLCGFLPGCLGWSGAMTELSSTDAVCAADLP